MTTTEHFGGDVDTYVTIDTLESDRLLEMIFESRIGQVCQGLQLLAETTLMEPLVYLGKPQVLHSQLELLGGELANLDAALDAETRVLLLQRWNTRHDLALVFVFPLSTYWFEICYK